MYKVLLVAAFTGLLAALPSVYAYDPAPDPRMSPNSRSSGANRSNNTISSGGVTMGSGERRRGGEEESFGGRGKRRSGGGGYGGGARAGN